MNIRYFTALALYLISGAMVNAQAQFTVASAHELGTDCAYENVFIGPALSTGNPMRATFTGGVTIGQYFARPLGKGIVASPQFEFGIVGPLPHGHPLDGLASVDFMFANKLPQRSLYPFVTGGYTRLFATGNAANLGFGFDVGKKDSEKTLRIELRDYYLFTGPQQHIIGLRLGFGKFIAD